MRRRTKNLISGSILALVLILAGCTADESVIKSRDWGAEDSEALAQLAMYIAPDSDTETKEQIMTEALIRVWAEDATVEEIADDMTDGGYKSMIPNKDCWKAESNVHYGQEKTD